MGRLPKVMRGYIACCCLAATLLGSQLGCAAGNQRYPLHTVVSLQQHPDAAGIKGSVSVARVEGGLRLVTVQLSRLPAPERVAPGLTEFVVWLRPPAGEAVRAGELAYDRNHLSGSLFATTSLPAFTVQVTGESDPSARTPSGVLLSERKVVTN